MVPTEKMKDIPRRPSRCRVRKLDSPTSSRRAARARPIRRSSFDYASRLTEFILLGNLAQHAGAGKKVEWDGPNMKVTNLPELNRWVKREYREGWRV